MIRVLLDTHTLLWAWISPQKLSKTARDILKDPNNLRLVSAVSGFEISVKFHIGKLAVEPALLLHYQDHLFRFQAEELVVNSQHALLAGAFPSAHRDPFDRLLAAQSQLERVPLLTADPAFREFPIQIIW